ncbi:MAG: TetR/AcrR family transcriptional regulator [Pseudomonadota bacterium]
MPRPSLKSERTDQILDALEICLVRYGLEGATQERIAAQAGLARALIRHNVGNRDDMLRLGLDRFTARSDEQLQALFGELPETGRAEVLLDWLFDPRFFDAHSVRVLESLSHWAADRSDARALVVSWTERFIDAVAEQLLLAFPNSKASDRDTVATCITGLYFQLASLLALGLTRSVQQRSVAAGRRLLAMLA